MEYGACFEPIWQQSIHLIQNELDCEYLNLDGSHSIAKKGGESVVYQHRKRAKNLVYPQFYGVTTAQAARLTGRA